MLEKIQKHLYLKIAMVILLLIFIFAGFIGYVLYSKSVSSLKEEAYGRLSQMALAYGNKLNIEMANTMQITETLASLVKEDFDTDKLALDPQYLNQQIERFEPYIRTIAQDFSLAKTAYIYYNWKLDGSPHDIYYVDHDNDGAVSRQEQLPIAYFEADLPERGSKDWWFGPIKSKTGYWSPPYKWTFDDGSHVFFLSYTQAIFEEDQLIGVVGTDFKYSNLTTLLETIQVYDSGFPFLLNADHVFLIHPTAEGKSLKELTDEPFKSLFRQIPTESTGNIAYVDEHGDDWYVTYYKLLNNWTLGLAAPVSEITASAQSMSILVMIILCIAVPFIVLVAFFAARRMTDPIHELTETVRKIELGELNTPINPHILSRKDELGTLGHVIQNMGLTLSDKLNEIIQKNEQLENEISEKIQAKDRFKLVYEAFGAAQNGMIITNARHEILLANPSFNRLIEFNEDVIGLSLEDILKQVCHDENIRLSKEAFSHEKLIITQSDSPSRYLWLVLTRIEGKDGTYQYIGALEDQTETIYQAQNIEFLKDHDAQTNLLNKPSMLHHITGYISKTASVKEIAALITINIDDFRMINEAMGYNCGDAVILEMSNRLKAFLKPDHVLARGTGDEFLIFIKNIADLEEIEAFAQTVLSLAQAPTSWKGHELFITFSMGISIYPFDTEEADPLFSYSTAALNNVKATGKNNFKFYSQEMAERAFEKYELSNQLREALEKHEFYLLYQPIIELPDRKVHGAEALIRWQHATKGVISPDRFIPLAEANGTIEAIGEWVIQEVCLQINRWKAEHFHIGHISINLSSLQLNRTQFAQKAHNILSAHNVSTEQISMEITESALILQNSVASQNLAQLKALNFEIHIDDFGTGFSSLAYLRNFKIDVLKIDRAFIKGIPTQDNGDLARLIIDLSNSLGIHTIAEGVETLEQLEFLQKHGCRYIQGYLFSKPITPEALKTFRV